MTRTYFRLMAAAAGVVLTAGCEASKSENPLSPVIAGPIPGVEITAPVLLEPGPNWRLKSNEQPITLLVENASSNGPRPLFYRFEVAADGGFASIVFSRDNVNQGENGRTSLRLPEALQHGRNYYWRARAADGANTGPFAAAVGFEIQPPATIFSPVALDPIGGQTIDTRRPTLRTRNALRQGPVGRVNYTFQLSLNSTFTLIAAQGTVPEMGGGVTEFIFGHDLEYQHTHYWRVMASDGAVSSPWETTTFKTPNRPAPPAPAPGGGGGAACGPPNFTTGPGIVECRRSQYGTPMSSAQILEFLRNVTRDLNAAGVSGGPFGILRKSGGHNCFGYSCDVICSGQGNSQQQWDVLGDVEGAANPAWIGPNTAPNIRIDVCEIQ